MVTLHAIEVMNLQAFHITRCGNSSGRITAGTRLSFPATLIQLLTDAMGRLRNSISRVFIAYLNCTGCQDTHFLRPRIRSKVPVAGAGGFGERVGSSAGFLDVQL